jgi:hypothetical protein
METLSVIFGIVSIVFIIWVFTTHVYPYMQKNTSNPELYTALALGGFLAIIYVTQGNLFMRVVVKNAFLAPFLK